MEPGPAWIPLNWGFPFHPSPRKPCRRETGAACPGVPGRRRLPQERGRLWPRSQPLPPPENKRDIQQWPVAARATPQGKLSVKSGCAVTAFKSARAPPAVHTRLPGLPLACVPVRARA